MPDAKIAPRDMRPFLRDLPCGADGCSGTLRPTGVVLCADPVPDECLVEVAALFYRYGWSGILYWVLRRRGETRCAFADVNRAVQFVREEEAIRAEVPSDTQRAYLQRTYTLGDE